MDLMSYFDARLWDGKIVSIESTRMPGHYLDAHHDSWVKFTSCGTENIREKIWAQWKIH